jgi:hypothetical protein
VGRATGTRAGQEAPTSEVMRLHHEWLPAGRHCLLIAD